MNESEDLILKIDEEDLILIVDDVEENLILLKRILARDGYRVEVTANSVDVLKVSKKLKPALILLDVQMPDTDGYEVCKQLKNEPSTRSIPVIFISAMESTVDKLRGFHAGAVDYIVKPIEIDETLARVRSHVTIGRLQKQLQEVNNNLDTRINELTNTQIQLHEREIKLKALVEAMPNITFIYDELGTYLEIIGHETNNIVANGEEMIGKTVYEFLPPEIAKLKMDAIEFVIQTGQTRVAEYQIPLWNGKNTWFEGRFALVEKNGPDKGKVICVTTEVTERVELYQQVQSLAIQDPLTNCFNRRHFLSLAEIEINRARRYDRPLSLMMLDIDHFKHINDQYGHPIGDQVLRQLVDLCQQSIRKIDILSRYGGDEFVILFPETDMRGAFGAAEKIRKRVEEGGILTNKGVIPITISAGLAYLGSMPEKNITLDEFIDEADKALYQAKINGRNQIRTNHNGFPVRVDLETILAKSS